MLIKYKWFVSARPQEMDFFIPRERVGGMLANCQWNYAHILHSNLSSKTLLMVQQPLI